MLDMIIHFEQDGAYLVISWEFSKISHNYELQLGLKYWLVGELCHISYEFLFPSENMEGQICPFFPNPFSESEVQFSDNWSIPR